MFLSPIAVKGRGLVRCVPTPLIQKASSMFPIPQIELNVVQMFISHIEELCPEDDYLAQAYLHILKICEWQRKRKLRKKIQTLQDLQVLKNGHRAAEHFLLEIEGQLLPETVRQITNILQLIALEFHAEIMQIEAQHPELRAEFAREKERYRVRWNDYLEAIRTDD